MIEEMTKERAFAILGLPTDANFSAASLAFRNLRDKYHPDINPRKRREYTEVVGAFEYLQRMFSN